MVPKWVQLVGANIPEVDIEGMGKYTFPITAEDDLLNIS